MRYDEDREQSGEILRLVLGLMGRQAAAFHPSHYALWYEHCGGLNPQLSRTLEARLTANSRLTDEDVRRLYAEHIEAREYQQYEALRKGLERVLQDTSETTVAADAGAAELHLALTGHERRLASPLAQAAVQEAVSDLLSDTGKMRAIAAKVVARLKISSDEVSSLTERLQLAEHAATVDPLTGLKNRRGFDAAAAELGSGGNLRGAALLMIDIDRFKIVNDTHGHLLGDKVLRAVADALRAYIKGRDVAVRLGGEEFAVLLPETSIEGATVLANRICSVVSQWRVKRTGGQGTIGQVTLSIGVAVAADEDSLETLMERADAALYEAKRSGRNRVAVARASENL